MSLINERGETVFRDPFGTVALIQNTESLEMFFARVSVLTVQSKSSEPGEPIRPPAGTAPRLLPRTSLPGSFRMVGPGCEITLDPFGFPE